MGLDPNHKNWELMGHNWVEPNNYVIWDIMNKHYYKKNGAKNV